MDTSVLVFGEGQTTTPTQAQPPPTGSWRTCGVNCRECQGLFFLRSWEMEVGQLHHCAESMSSLPSSLPGYLSSQDWGPFIIPSVTARSNLHCQRLKPVTSSNSIPRTGPKQKLVRWRCDLRLLPPWFLSFTRMVPLTERPGFQVSSGPR